MLKRFNTLAPQQQARIQKVIKDLRAASEIEHPTIGPGLLTVGSKDSVAGHVIVVDGAYIV